MSELGFGNQSDFDLKFASLGPLLVWFLVEIWSDKSLILRFLGLIFCLVALGMVSRNREWGLLGRNKLEQGQRDVPSPVWINRAGPGTGIKLIKFHFRQSALALDWVCPAGLNSWSVTLLFNRTILNVLSICKVKYPDSLLPLPWGSRLGVGVFSKRSHAVIG